MSKILTVSGEDYKTVYDLYSQSQAEVDELRLQNKILSANREADEKDIVELKAEVNRLKGEQR